MIQMPNDNTNRLEPNFPDLSTVNADRLWICRCSLFFLHILLIALDFGFAGYTWFQPPMPLLISIGVAIAPDVFKSWYWYNLQTTQDPHGSKQLS
jgi:hypothetical protein